MDDTTPATKADIRMLFSASTDLEERISTRFERVHDELRLVVDTVNRIDRRLTRNLTTHERRITRLEQHVGLGA